MFQKNLGKKLGYTIAIVIILQIIYSIIKISIVNLGDFRISSTADKIIFGLIIAFSILIVNYTVGKKKLK